MENFNSNLRLKNPALKYRPAILITLVAVLLLLLVLLTKYYGSIDTGDYADTAKFFAGDYPAKLRIAHSALYGILHAPLIKMTGSFTPMKVSSVFWLLLLTLSMYYISKKDKRTLLLFVAAPVVWYIAPWINPIQLSSLLFLWAYYFIARYDKEEKIRYLLYAGLLAGLSWAFWEAMIYFSILLGVFFLYDKKSFHTLYFVLALVVGVLPKLILDQMLFGFAFYSIAKHFAGVLSSHLYGGAYSDSTPTDMFKIPFFLLVVPLFTYLLFKKNNFRQDKKTTLFIAATLLLAYYNDTQIRYLLIVIPIILILLGRILTDKQFLIQLALFVVISLIVINPYLIQIKYDTSGRDIVSLTRNLTSLNLNSSFEERTLNQNLLALSADYPNQQFIVGPKPDDYQKLAHAYWGKNIEEFVSMQDYQLYLNNETTLAEKTICSQSKPWNRRDICISVSLEKAMSDATDYRSIKYALSTNQNFSLSGFSLEKAYGSLYLFRKI